MIYFDNGATSMQKPEKVYQAAAIAMRRCANPGRSGHMPSLQAANEVFSCREAAAAFFGLSDPARVIFTANCTASLNMAIKGVMKRNGHAVISGYEHNSVVRPLEKMKEAGVRYTVAVSRLFDPEAAVRAFKKALRKDTKCVVCTHVSNVFGFVLPVYEIDRLCYEKGLPLILDAAQSAGSFAIDVSEFRALACLCAPGHKGLLGPQGTGLLLVCHDRLLDTVMEGGTGSNSMEMRQPGFYPDRLESGTLNVPGIAGLREGIRHIAKIGPEAIGAHERAIVLRVAEGLAEIPGVEVFCPSDASLIAGVLSFRGGMETEELAAAYGEKGICVRAGLHCASLAHRSAGTLATGTVRISPGWNSTAAEADRFVAATREILSQGGNP